MPTPRRQGARAVVVVACVCCLFVSCAASAAPPIEGRYARQLAEECDQLIGLAVKRPYGWAWTARVAEGAGDRRPQVEMRPPGTPGAGLVLLWAGVLLEDSRYTEAAVHVARGMVASQAANGNVVSRPAFAMAQPTKREPPGDVPDRAATRAGVALLLAARGAEESKDEMFKRAAVRAAAWLANQQADDGGWPGAPPEGTSRRVIRLDDRDVRDSLLALVLAAGAVDDRPATVAARRAADKLIALPISGGDRWSNLWSSIYQPDGSLVDELEAFPPGADVLASRRAAEALLVAGLLLDHEPARVAASDAARSLERLRNEQGEWTRLYVLEGEQPAPVGESVFGPAATQSRDEMFAAGTFGVPRFLDAVAQLQQVGADQFLAQLSRSASPHERLASTVCGLSDEPFSTAWPARVEDVAGYIREYDALWRQLEGPPPDELDRRVARLYALLLRARLEAQFPDAGAAAR